MSFIIFDLLLPSPVTPQYEACNSKLHLLDCRGTTSMRPLCGRWCAPYRKWGRSPTDAFAPEACDKTTKYTRKEKHDKFPKNKTKHQMEYLVLPRDEKKDCIHPGLLFLYQTASPLQEVDIISHGVSFSRERRGLMAFLQYS